MINDYIERCHTTPMGLYNQTAADYYDGCFGEVEILLCSSVSLAFSLVTSIPKGVAFTLGAIAMLAKTIFHSLAMACSYRQQEKAAESFEKSIQYLGKGITSFSEPLINLVFIIEGLVFSVLGVFNC